MKKIFLLLFILSPVLIPANGIPGEFLIDSHMDMPKLQELPHIFLSSGHSYGMKEEIDLENLDKPGHGRLEPSMEEVETSRRETARPEKE